MANSTLRYNDTNKSLPYINFQRPASASNRFETRKSISFDPLERTAQRHESQYSRQAFADQSQLLDNSKPFRHDVAKSDRLLAQSSGSLVQPYTFDASLKHLRPVPPSYPRNDYTSQVREMQLQLEQRDDRIWKLQVALDSMRETETQQLSTIQQLKRQLMFYETKDAVSNSSAVINNLQQEARDSQQRVEELESRLRTHMEERERAEQERSSVEKTYMEAMTTLSNVLFCDSSNNSMTFDEIINKVSEMVHENSMMRGRQASVKELVGNLEMEQKTNRETIARLTSEIEKNQHIVSRSCIDVDNVRVERDAALSKQEELTKELEMMKMRLESSHRAWSQMKAELEEARISFSSSEAEKQRRSVADTLEGQRFTRFRENLASLLSDGTVVVDPYEEQILSQVNKLVSAVAEKINAMNTLEKKLGDISAELERQFEVTKSERNKQKQLQGLVEELEEDLRRRGSKETVDQVLNNKDRFIKMLNKIASTLRMSPFKDSAPLEVVANEIVSCVEDLINRFSNKSNSDDDDVETMRVHVVNLQRKVKSLKEQLNVKDGQLDELGERMKEMEDKLSTLEIRDEDESTRVRKMSKILEKYKLELNEAHMEMRQLRARLLEAADLKSDSAAKEEEVKKLRNKLKHIDQESTKLKHEVSRLHHESQNMSQVTSELRSAKSALEEMTRQHKQLFELRQLLAGMLGIPYNTSVAVDFEMISRLEKLIVAIYRDPDIMENFHIDPNNSIGLAEEFKRGYSSVVDQTKPVRSRQEKALRSHNVNARELNSRPRSLSPQKKMDTKVY